MAYFDHEAAERRRICAEKFEELKKHIVSQDENGKFNEYFLAHEHIYYLENRLKEQEEQIREYRSFFSLLSKLLPRQSSIYDVIG